MIEQKEKRIMFVITGLRMGGAEMQCLLLTKALISRGVDVCVVVMESGGILVSDFKHCGARVYELGISGGFSLLQGMFRFRKILRRERPTVVHGHMIHANFFSRITRLIAPMNMLICTAHNITEGGERMMKIYRYTDFLSNYNTNVSQEALDNYVTKGYFSSGKAVFISNAIDTERFRFEAADRLSTRTAVGVENESYLFLAVGRLHEQKDYPNLLRAFAKIADMDHETRLLIVGEGDVRNEIEKLIETLGLAQRVYLLGIRLDIPQLMSAADCFVLSSAYEGFGLVVAEGLSCQLPVVATDAGGVREVLGAHGTLVPPRDSELLYEAMYSARKNGKKRNIYGREYVVEHYDIKNLIKKWLDLYGI